MMKTAKAFATGLVFLALACDGVAGDTSMFLTGTEEEALTMSNGQPSCAAPKVLVCHIPPGNPANAHSICVGAPAVEPHQRLHGDTLGACGPVGGTGGGSAGTGGGSGTGGSGGGTAPVCVQAGGTCTDKGQCCAGLDCAGGVCTPIIP